MNASDETGGDPAEAILGLDRSGPANADLRAALLERTTGIIRRRRRLRRLAMAAALAAFYVAGATTVWTWWAWRPVAPAAPNERLVGDETAPAPAAPGPRQVPPPPRVPAPAGTEEAVATVKASPFEFYRRAGDRFLQEPAQLSLAVRSYRNALNVASAEERAISPERDTWLLMALKESRLKERSHGNRDH